MRGLRPLVVAVLLASLLAGCADAPKKSDSDSPQAFQGLTDDVAVTDTTGSIGGVVVDAAIRPLANANVTLVSQNKVATTDADGRFSFEDLAPGAYFLNAVASRHEQAQVSVDVVAGEVAPVRILLADSLSADPYHVTLNYHGHIDAYLGELSFVGQLVAPGTLPCTCEWTVTPDANLTTVMFEATGNTQVPYPDTPATNGGDAYWELWENNDTGSGHTGYAFFPISKRIEALDDPTDPFVIRITGGAYVTGSMDYDIYLTLFYLEKAPEGWSFLNGDA